MGLSMQALPLSLQRYPVNQGNSKQRSGSCQPLTILKCGYAKKKRDKMKLRLETLVEQSADEVWAGFDEDLFRQLAPPFPKLKVLHFDGSTTGKTVKAEINFFLFKQIWESIIVDHGENEDQIWFVDEGKQLPFFLRSWRHEHLILRKNSRAVIVDQIEYRSPLRVLDWLLYPSMWLQFAYRKPIYRRYFAVNRA